jgi:DNA-3-methyladenine glycosylase
VTILQNPLPKAFYDRDTLEVARDLLGRQLWKLEPGGDYIGGLIVEVEAYLGADDQASHAFRRTPRSEIMYGPPGVAYVYFTYGMHHCLNAVCESDGKAGAVLIRAMEPIRGAEVMALRRGNAAFDAGGRPILKAICSGPGKLTQALAIDLAQNGTSLQGPDILITAGDGSPDINEIGVTGRIGVREESRLPARFIMLGSDCLSRPPGGPGG